jgi:hypothetical protein
VLAAGEGGSWGDGVVAWCCMVVAWWWGLLSNIGGLETGSSLRGLLGDVDGCGDGSSGGCIVG